MRSIATGRKNRLFAGSKAGGERAAAIYSVIGKIASGWPASRWDELMPWNWQPAEQSQIAQPA